MSIFSKAAQTNTGKTVSAVNPAPRYTNDGKEGIYRDKKAKDTGIADIMLAGALICGPKQIADGDMDFKRYFKVIRDRIGEADLAAASSENLFDPSMPWAGAKAMFKKAPESNAPEAYLEAVRDAGFDITAVSDGTGGGRTDSLRVTAETMASHGLLPVGPGGLPYLVADVNGIKVGFVSKVFSCEGADKDIQEARDAGAEFVIVYMHWQGSAKGEVTERQRRDAEELAGAGADLIVGTGQHAVQAYEKIAAGERRVSCYYSLGDLQSDIGYEKARESIIVRIKLERDNDGKVVIKSEDVLPCYGLEDKGMGGYSPMSISDTGNSYLSLSVRNRKLKSISETLGFESMSVKRWFLRLTIEKMGWTAKEAYTYMEYLHRTGGISYADIFIDKEYRKFRIEQASELREYMENGTPITDYSEGIDYSGLEELYLSDRQKRAWEKICAGEFTPDVIFDYMQLDLPESLKNDHTNYYGRLYTRPTRLKDNSVFFCIRQQDVKPEVIKKKDPVCVIGFSSYVKRFKEAGMDIIGCHNLGSYYLDFSYALRIPMDIKTVGISGSIGKTTTTQFINALVEPSFNAYTIRGNQNTSWQICKTIYDLKPEHEVYVQEASGAFIGQLEKSTYVLRPNIFVLTVVSDSHIEKFDGRQELLLYEKLALDRHADENGIGIMNWDNKLLKKVPYKHKIISYAVEDETADLRGVNIKEENGGIVFDVLEKDGTLTPVRIRTMGRHNVLNALAAFGVGLALGMDRSVIAGNLLGYRTKGVRQNLMQLNGQHVYLDCYNASAASIKSALETIKGMEVPAGGSKIAVLADIAELGDLSEEAHRQVGRIVRETGAADETVFFGPLMKYAYEEAERLEVSCRHTVDRDELEDILKKDTKPGDCVLFKGSHATHLTHVVDDIYSTHFWIKDESNYYPEISVVDGLTYGTIEDYGTFIKGRKLKKNVEFTAVSEVNGSPVRAVAENAFRGRDITSVHLPKGLRTIGEGAFAGCTELEEIEIPSVEYIGIEAFEGCTALKTISIPEGALTIDEKAFEGCDALEVIVLPSSLVNINEGAFEGTDDPVFKVQEGSYAQRWAEENGYRTE